VMVVSPQSVETEPGQRCAATPRLPRLLPRQVLTGLCACIAVLLCGYVATVAVRLITTHHLLFGLVHLLDLDEEANIPTYFSVVQFNIAACLLWMIGAHARSQADRYARHWLALAVVFLFLGLDELAQIHELIGVHLRVTQHLSGALSNAWVMPYAVLVLLVGWAYVRFLAYLPARSRALMILSAVIYVGGAAGLEMYGGYLTTQLGGQAAADNSLRYLTEVFFEEGMEMFGIALFIYTLLDCIQATTGRIRINVGPAPAASPEQELDATGALQILQLGERTTRRTSESYLTAP